MEDRDRILGVAKEPNIGNLHNEKNQEKTKCNATLKMWLQGIILLLVPLFVLPVYLLFMSELDCSYWKNVLGSAEIVFISVSIIVSSLNDTSNRFPSHSWMLFLHKFIMIVGSIIYGMMKIAEYTAENGQYNINVTIIFNIIFLVVSFLLGLSSYLK